MSTSEAQVLVVDDEPVIRQQLSRALNMVGISCDCAVDGDDALSRFSARFYPLVVTDLRMPHRHGHSLVLELQSRARQPKIVALTGVTERWLAKDLMTHGIDEVIYKPVNYFDLANHLRRMLSTIETIELTSKAAPASSDDSLNKANASHAAVSNQAALSDRLSKQASSSFQNPWLVTALEWLDWRRVPNPPEDLWRYVTQLTKEEVDHMPWRQCKLTDKSRLAVAISLNNNLEPLGNPFKFLIRQMTQQQVTLVNSALPQGSHLGVVWMSHSKQRVAMLLKLTNSHALEHGYEITCEIVNRYGKSNTRRINS